MGAIGALALALETAALCRDLGHWPPVGGVHEAVLGALRGHDGVSPQEANRLRRWARAWGALLPELREWLCAHTNDPAVAVGLRYALDGGARPDGWAIGRARRLWESEHGSTPPFELFPTPGGTP